jgi:transglutaminase-like putative cysteine protease
VRYQIVHTTDYRYSAPVRLLPHLIRLCPRNDGAQWLEQFKIDFSPLPAQQTYWLDANGNTCLQITFDEPIEALHIRAMSEVCTTRANPFDYRAEPWALRLPIDYPSALSLQLRPYLDYPQGWGVDEAIAPEILSFARAIRQEVDGNVGYFLTRLSQLICEKCDYQQRLAGEPYPPATTLAQRAGTCRDFSVLFVAVCRSVGLAARFVSGYQEGDLTQASHDLHAWAEVYVPGGGWRGFDPTLGLAVSDRHVALAAAANPRQAAPVSGSLQPGPRIETRLESDIRLAALTEH